MIIRLLLKSEVLPNSVEYYAQVYHKNSFRWLRNEAYKVPPNKAATPAVTAIALIFHCIEIVFARPEYYSSPTKSASVRLPLTCTVRGLKRKNLDEILNVYA